MKSNNSTNPQAISNGRAIALTFASDQRFMEWLNANFDYDPAMALREAAEVFVDGSVSLEVFPVAALDFDTAEALGLDGTLRS